MDFKELIIKELKAPEAHYCMTKEFERTAKSSELAKKIRDVGNELYTKEEHNVAIHEKIWDSYSCSIALSPSGSEALALSHGNMSALLYHICKYEDCIKSIDRALQITKSVPFKVKLLCRKAKCLGALGRSEKDSVFEEANFWLKKISDKDEQKKEVLKLVRKAKIILEKSKPKAPIIEDFSAENIIFTQSVADSPKKKKNKRKKKQSTKTHSEILAEMEKKDVFHSVTISVNDTYGRHLTATRDIRPGEIIFVTKPYVIVPNFNRSQNFCNNCIKMVWSGIPCDNCACCIYCSEECQKEAQQKYHDIECTVLQFAIIGGYIYDYHIHASMRAVITAVREYGSIAALKDVMNNIDSGTDNYEEFKKGKFRYDSFEALFGFKNIYVEPEILTDLAKSCCRVIIGLAKFTSFFGKDCKINKIEDLIENDEVLFIGTILLRVALIIYNNGIKVTELGTSCKNNLDQSVCMSSLPCCEWGYSINTMSSLIPHSCDPTVKSIKTEGCKEIWYALQPIYKGDPLLECYGTPFYELKLTDRYEATTQILKKNCFCIACTENWPAVLAPEGQLMGYEEVFQIVIHSREFNSEKAKFMYIVKVHGLTHQKVVNELSDIIEASFDYFGQPSAEVSAAMCVLQHTFNVLYGLELCIPDKCRILYK